MATEGKKVFAKIGENVFSYVETGVWAATLFGDEVIVKSVGNLKWECRDKFTNELLGEGTTRNMAMREAFFEKMLYVGYDEKEAERLDWVLEEQPYRSYGGHRPRKGGKNTQTKTKASRNKVVNLNNHKDELRDNAVNTHRDNRKSINAPEDHRQISDEYDAAMSVERLKQAIGGYRTAFNPVMGGFFYYQRDKNGRMVGEFQGPFTTEKDMFTAIIENECSASA